LSCELLAQELASRTAVSFTTEVSDPVDSALITLLRAEKSVVLLTVPLLAPPDAACCHLIDSTTATITVVSIVA
jgi:hypothetical protein